MPQEGGGDGESDPLAELISDLRTVRGRVLLLETTGAGWGDGRGAAPMRDWRPERPGPNPPASFEAVMGRGF